MVKEYLTVDEVCKWLKVSRNSLDRWRKMGMPFIKTGRLVRFERAEVEKWLEEHKN